MLTADEPWIELPSTGDIARRISKNAIKGFLIDIFDELSSQMNFTYELFIRKDQLWGHQNLVRRRIIININISKYLQSYIEWYMEWND